MRTRHMAFSVELLLISLISHLSIGHGSVMKNRRDVNSFNTVDDTFNVGSFHPPLAEAEVCRPIRSFIQRNSGRYINELVTNTNPLIDFPNLDSQVMSSRLKSNLDILAELSHESISQRMNVIMAWTAYPDPDLGEDKHSLHYEGRTIRITLPAATPHIYSVFLNLAIAAGFDWVYYEDQNFVRLSVLPSNCNRQLDGVFILDQSTSVGQDNHEIAKTLVKKTVSFFNIAPQLSRFGLIAYSTREHLEFDLNHHTSLSSLLTGIDSVRYRGGWSATALGLNAARDLLNPQYPFGARPHSEGIPKIAILITDGSFNRYPISNVVLSLKRSGVQVYSVGIGGEHEGNLELIASEPSDWYTLVIEPFSSALDMADTISTRVCEARAIIQPGPDVAGTVIEGGHQYYQYDCGTLSDMLLVEITDAVGTAFLYCSTVEPNPGPLTANTTSNEQLSVSRRSCTIQTNSTQGKYYIGVYGVERENNYTLAVWNRLFTNETVTIETVEGYTGVVYDIHTAFLRPCSVSLFAYTIEGDQNNNFHISTMGILSVRSPLNITQQQSHRVTLVAQNTQSICQRAFITIHVKVICNQVNFNKLNVKEIPEDTEIGDIIAIVSTTCGDHQFHYTIIEGNTANVFDINETSGAILINRTLDFESMDTRYNLTIKAVGVNQSTIISGTITQTILITDVNEPPFFTTPCALSEQGCHFSLDENHPAGYQVGVIEGHDPDITISTLRYELTPHNVPLAINTQGQLMTTEILDREQIQEYGLVVTIHDCCGGLATTGVSITVNDLNDNPPIFTQAPTNITVAENSPNNLAVAQFIATDVDVPGVNGDIQYILSSESTDPFHLDPVNGVLSVNGSIDYEASQAYTLCISAHNPCLEQSAMIITRVEVLNLNDNTPLFSQELYHTSVIEHSSYGTFVITVSAIDADLQEFGEVMYFIESGNFEESFAIDDRSGEIFVANDIDRETISSFNLTILATDGSRHQAHHSNRANVHIKVEDINDHAPAFLSENYTISVLENKQPFSTLLYIFASDVDEPGQPNSQVHYSIADDTSTELFGLNFSTGLLQLIQTLDSESEPSHDIVIIAYDMGDPQMTSTTTITIEVINVNEHAPIVNGGEITIDVSESTLVGSILTTLEASDADGMNLSFKIISGNDEDKFTFQGNGQLVLNGTLDFESTCGSPYVLEICVTDGFHNSTVDLIINVVEENEYAPVVIGGTDFELHEETQSGTLVGQVTAIDHDACASVSNVMYHFASDQIYFKIDPESGEITTRVLLDRESLSEIFPPSSSQLSVELIISDAGSPPLLLVINVSITLLDINDNSPVFDEEEYHSSLLENLPAGQTVFQVSAADIDLNGAITYSLSCVSNLPLCANPFEVDSSSGVVITTQPLDYENQTDYVLLITAEDSGTVPRSSEVTGYVSVIDTNDNAPSFSRDVYHVQLSESVPIMTELFQIAATDRDSGRNGEVQYSIADSCIGLLPICETFLIDSTSGILMNKVQFDFETFNEITVTIEAHDLGTPTLTHQAVIIVTVLNEDEEGPHFIGSCDVTLEEEIPAGETVTQCIAVDPDNITTSKNVTGITYTVTLGNDAGRFRIDRNTGVVYANSVLDREEQASYHLTLEATDLSGKTATTSLWVTLKDINDNAPQFLDADITATFNRSDIESYSQSIVNVTAIDLDHGANGTIRYAIGSISRDRDFTDTVVEIIAMDLGTPPKSVNLSLHIVYDTPCALQTYEIDEVNGVLMAQVFCLLEIEPKELNLTLGENRSSISCNVLSNIQPLTYQWLHNGRFITSSEVLNQGDSEFSYILVNATTEDAGEYACKVSSSVGSLQSTSTTVNTVDVQGSKESQSHVIIEVIIGLCVPIALLPVLVITAIIGAMEYKKHATSKRTRTYGTANSADSCVFQNRPTDRGGSTSTLSLDTGGDGSTMASTTNLTSLEFSTFKQLGN